MRKKYASDIAPEKFEEIRPLPQSAPCVRLDVASKNIFLVAQTP